MNLSIVRMTEDPVDAIAAAFAITRGIPYEEYVKSSRKTKENLIINCYESGHLSGFEFADIDVEVLGVSRVFEVDAVRSRLSSFEVEAGKFSEARDFEMVNPAGAYPEWLIRERQAVIRQWNAEDKAQDIDPRLRRYFTYQGLARNMRIKRNLRAWMETAWLRMCSCTQWEYKKFYLEFKLQMAEKEPFLAQFIMPKCMRLGYCPEVWEPCGRMPKKADVIGPHSWKTSDQLAQP